MQLFGVGPLELIVILVVALVFVGPERLPKLAADLARTIREIRQYTGSIAAEFNEMVEDISKDTESERGEWKQITEGIAGATQSVTEVIRGARADMIGSPGPATSRGAAAGPGVSGDENVREGTPALPSPDALSAGDTQPGTAVPRSASSGVASGAETPALPSAVAVSLSPDGGLQPASNGWVEIPEPGATPERSRDAAAAFRANGVGHADATPAEESK